MSEPADHTSERLRTDRLELLPLPPAAAAVLPGDRRQAAALIGAGLSPEWPQPDVVGILPRQAAATPEQARFGIWVIVLEQARTVIGDAGFHGPPERGVVEIGYAITPAHRRNGYATEAAAALIAWVRRQPGVSDVTARCDRANLASVLTLERLGFTRGAGTDAQIHWRL